MYLIWKLVILHFSLLNNVNFDIISHVKSHKVAFVNCFQEIAIVCKKSEQVVYLLASTSILHFYCYHGKLPEFIYYSSGYQLLLRGPQLLPK